MLSKITIWLKTKPLNLSRVKYLQCMFLGRNTRNRENVSWRHVFIKIPLHYFMPLWVKIHIHVEKSLNIFGIEIWKRGFVNAKYGKVYIFKDLVAEISLNSLHVDILRQEVWIILCFKRRNLWVLQRRYVCTIFDTFMSHRISNYIKNA